MRLLMFLQRSKRDKGGWAATESNRSRTWNLLTLQWRTKLRKVRMGYPYGSNTVTYYQYSQYNNGRYHIPLRIEECYTAGHNCCI